MEMDNWSAHGKAFQSQELHCWVHLSKVLHKCLLPRTFHQLNKYGGSQHTCPACGTADKTRDHIIWCGASSRRAAWRAELWDAIAVFHSEQRTVPLLIHVVLRSAMKECLQSESDVLASDHSNPVFIGYQGFHHTTKCNRMASAL